MTRPTSQPEATELRTTTSTIPDGVVGRPTATDGRTRIAAGTTLLGRFAIPLGVGGLASGWRFRRECFRSAPFQTMFRTDPADAAHAEPGESGVATRGRFAQVV